MNSFDDLPAEVVYLIASFDQNSWYKLARIWPNFRKYAYSDRGKTDFINLFTVKTVTEENDIVITTYTLFGKKHKTDGPAVIKIASDTKRMFYHMPVRKHSYYQNGEKFRPDDLPTTEYYNVNSLVKQTWRITWCGRNLLHRENDLPAIICYQDGEVRSHTWCRMDVYHRAKGPAFIDFIGGFERYFHFGKRVDPGTTFD